jgi:hypothetical protein
MEIMAALERALAEITGMDAVTLQPAAGAHGELTGIFLIRALLESRGYPRKRVLVPDSAHGTNPATVRMAGYEVEHVASNDRGMVDMGAGRNPPVGRSSCWSGGLHPLDRKLSRSRALISGSPGATLSSRPSRIHWVSRPTC